MSRHLKTDRKNRANTVCATAFVSNSSYRCAVEKKRKKKEGESRSNYESAIIRIDDNNRDEYNDFCNSRQFLLLIIPRKILDQT